MPVRRKCVAQFYMSGCWKTRLDDGNNFKGIFTDKKRTPSPSRDHVLPSVCDLISAIKQSVGFSKNSVRITLDKIVKLAHVSEIPAR
jgi:hypothetical protein